uniref:Uncharacterized protein n=1 Tax=Chrysemys picta bellii TaxID=8478 RepID=A0A8C3IH26_CHRPI
KRPKPFIQGPSIPNLHIQLHSLLYPMIWLGFKFQIRSNRRPTSSSPNYLVRSDPRNYPTLINFILRTNIPNIFILATDNNRIHLHISRNKSGTIRPNQRRIRTGIRI